MSGHADVKAMRARGLQGWSKYAADYWTYHALQVAHRQFDVVLSVDNKAEDTLKFGRNHLVGTSKATIQQQPAGILHESYVSSDLITTIVSDNAGDTDDARVFGHTTDDGGLTFHVLDQDITLNGTTPVTLPTPIARVSRVRNYSATPWVGVLSVTEDDTFTGDPGVPDTDAGVHLQVPAGDQTSQKAAAMVCDGTYWFITSYYCDLLDKIAGFAEVALEIRAPGGVFQERISISCSDKHRGVHEFRPYLLVPQNNDVRLVAAADGISTDISGGIQAIRARIEAT